MAIYKSGLEVEPAQLKAGEFEITFDCKPQRYLTSGEAPIEVSDGDVILNPTLFEAHPLLEVEGYGAINFSNGYTINITDELVGVVEIIPAKSGISYNESYSDNILLVDDGDPMTLPGFDVSLDISTIAYIKIDSVTLTRTTSNIPNYLGHEFSRSFNTRVMEKIKYGEQSFVKQNAAAEMVDSFTMTIVATKIDNTQVTLSNSFDIRMRNSCSDKSLTIELANVSTANFVYCRENFNVSAFIADSSQSVRGNPVYIDCDLGEAYKMVDGAPASLNRYIDLGSRLPTLAVGNTEITYDNTITELNVTPRWWKV